MSRFFGLIRDKILAGMFGASGDLDAYYAAFRIPDLVYSLLVLGATSAGFIPVFTDYLNKRQKFQVSGFMFQVSGHWHLANSVLNLMALCLLAVCFFLAVFAPYLIKLVVPGFSVEQSLLAAPWRGHRF